MVRVYELFPRLQCAPNGDRFPDFYSAYPRRIAKAEAEKAWIQAMLQNHDPAVIIQGAKCFAELCRREGTEPKFIPHPATWLRGRRWEDDGLEAYIPPTQQEIEDAKDRADRLLKRGKYAPQYK